MIDTLIKNDYNKMNTQKRRMNVFYPKYKVNHLNYKDWFQIGENYPIIDMESVCCYRKRSVIERFFL